MLNVLITKEFKTIMQYCFIFSQFAKRKKKLTLPSIVEDVGSQNLFQNGGGNVKWANIKHSHSFSI